LHEQVLQCQYTAKENSNASSNVFKRFPGELSNSAGEYGRRSSVEVGQEIKKAHAPPARRRGAYLPMSWLVCPQQMQTIMKANE